MAAIPSKPFCDNITVLPKFSLNDDCNSANPFKLTPIIEVSLAAFFRLDLKPTASFDKTPIDKADCFIALSNSNKPKPSILPQALFTMPGNPATAFVKLANPLPAAIERTLASLAAFLYRSTCFFIFSF